METVPGTLSWFRVLRGPLLLLFLGASQLGVGLAARVTDLGPDLSEALGTVGVVLGVTLLAFGLLALAFQVLTHRTVEWFLAWRYVKTQAGSRRTLVAGLLLGALAAGLLASAFFWARSGPTGFLPQYVWLIRYMQVAGLILALLAYLVIFFGILLVYFSLFTAISIFGVFLGTAALVVVLSVMGGFENDLRRKILGTTAHVTITRTRQMFTDYRQVVRQVRAMPDVVAATPFIESEVMVTSQTNLSGVLLRGIDPASIGQVTDLPRYLRSDEGAGSLDNLLRPEKLARLPASRFEPLVSEPLGEPPDFVREDDEPGLEKRRKPLEPIHEKTQKQKNDDNDNNDIKQDSEAKKAKAAKIAKLAQGLSSGHEAEQGRASAQGAGQGTGRTPAGIIRRLDGAQDEGPAADEERPMLRPVYPGIIIGAELAKNLRLYVGEDVNLVAPLGSMSPMGPIPRSKPFRVAGIFYSGMYEYDTKFAYITIPMAQRFLGLDDEITGMEIKVRDAELATPLAEKLRTLLGPTYQVRDWKQLNINLFTALKLERVVMFIVLIFIVLVASFSIITTLIMLVLEKRREIAALKAMGAKDHVVLKTFLYAGLFIGAIGMMVGLFTGLCICMFVAFIGLPLDPEVYYISELPVKMSVVDILLVALAAVTLSFLATIYPSLLAARLKPVDGLRRYAS